MLDDEQVKRVKEPKRSNSARMAWKKYGRNYRKGIRNRLRRYYSRNEDSMKNLIDSLKEMLNEAEVDKNNVFDMNSEILFDHIPGGISIKIDSHLGNVSFTTTVSESEQTGSYKTEQNLTQEEMNALFKQLTTEIDDLCDNFDKEFEQLLQRHGLLPTK